MISLAAIEKLGEMIEQEELILGNTKSQAPGDRERLLADLWTIYEYSYELLDGSNVTVE